jgi:hypothetical protein
MAFAQGSRSSLSYIVESTFGTTPDSNFTNLPFSTHSLNLTKDRVAGNDIQSDRMPRVDRHGNRQAGGDIVADMRDADYDAFLEAAMLNTWSTNVLKVGTTPKFFSIEDYAADIDQARLFTGMTVNTMGVSLAPNQMVTTTFGMVGKDMTVPTMSIDGGDDGNYVPKTQNPASGASPFDAYSGDLSIGDVGAGSTSAIVTGLDFTLTNGYAPTFVVGDDSAPSLEFGRAEVEGTLSAYFEDAALINRFIDETETEIEVSVGDGSNTMTFLFPRVKINSADVGVDGPTSRVISMSFVALYDDSSGGEATNLKITRSA